MNDYPAAYHHRLLCISFLMAAFLCLAGGLAHAQEFSVRTFRMLPNDISAYIDPVRDLNGEACALVKVVGDKDFAFSSPLGIVKRRNDVGEIWLYLPNGTRLLTLKHPQWGVIRDYRFHTPLESRMTYELVLTPPLGYRQPKKIEPLMPHPVGFDTLIHHVVIPPKSASPHIRRVRERMHYLALLNAGIRQGHPSLGIRVAAMRRHGAYILAQTDFHSSPTTHGTCDSYGRLEDGSLPYYSGKTKDSRWALMAGGIHRLIDEFCLYEGIGYGRRTTTWEQHDGTWLRNKDYTYHGLSAEAGCLYRFYRLALSAGVMTIRAKYWEASVGIGLHF